MFGFKKRRRLAEPGELCTCGRQAVVVFRSPGYGELGSCLSLDPMLPVKPCPFCGATEKHPRVGVCPRYTVRPARVARAELTAVTGDG